MAITNYPAGMLDKIEFVAVLTNYRGKWVYCFHKHRKSFEHPGGHVEPGETPMQAAKRELSRWFSSGDTSTAPAIQARAKRLRAVCVSKLCMRNQGLQTAD